MRVEVDLLARQIRQRLDLGPDEDVQFRGEQAEQIADAQLDLRYLGFVFLKRVAVDDRHIDASQIEQVIDVLGGPARHDRKDMRDAAIAHHPGNFRREVNGRAFKQAASETNGPGIEPLSDLRLVGAGRRRRLGEARIQRQQAAQQKNKCSCYKTHCNS